LESDNYVQKKIEKSNTEPSSRAKGSTNPMPDDAWPEDAYADNVVGHEEFRMSAS